MAARHLVEAHRMPIVHACRCVGLSRSAYYAPAEHWTVRDAEIIAALARLVEAQPGVLEVPQDTQA